MAVPKLPQGTRFTRGPGYKKYTAVLPDGRKVHFGDRRYEQYRDVVPKRLGGQIWAHKNHLDPVRRKAYRTRHSSMRCKNGKKCISIKYSPAWFSYYFLW